MQRGVRVSEETLANLPGVPRFGRNIQRHVNHDGSPDDVAARNAATEATVIGIATIVAHGEITIVGNAIGKFDVRVTRGRGAGRGRFAGANGVFFNEFLAVDPDGAVAEIDGVAREADDAFDVVRLIGGERRLEEYGLLWLWRAPQGHVPIGEGHSRIVPDAAHDEVIADEQCVLHRAGTNDAR